MLGLFSLVTKKTVEQLWTCVTKNGVEGCGLQLMNEAHRNRVHEPRESSTDAGAALSQVWLVTAA